MIGSNIIRPSRVNRFLFLWALIVVALIALLPLVVQSAPQFQRDSDGDVIMVDAPPDSDRPELDLNL